MNNIANKRQVLFCLLSLICITAYAQIPDIIYQWSGRSPQRVVLHRQATGTTNLSSSESSFSVVDGFESANGDIIVPKKVDIDNRICEGMLAFMDENDKWGYVNEEGKILIPCQYVEVGKFCEGLAVVQDTDRRWYYIDKNGDKKISLPKECTMAHHFSSGLAPVRIASKWGYIDKNGLFAIKCIYDNATSFSEDRAFVLYKGKWTCINAQGKIVYKTHYSYNGYPLNYGEWPIGYHYGVAKFFNVKSTLNIKYLDWKGDYIGPKLYEETDLMSAFKKQNLYYSSSFAFTIANMYYLGVDQGTDPYYPELVVEKNYAKAMEWYRKANDSRSRFMLGWMYQHGQGVPTNSQEAKSWYASSTETEARDMEKELLAASSNKNSQNDTEKGQSVTNSPIHQPTVAPSSQAIDIGSIKKERRIAMIIGNSAYKNTPLTSPFNDARKMATKLKELNFDIILCRNVDTEAMHDSAEVFENRLKDYDVALVYYSGHGMEDGEKKRTYLLPIDYKDRMLDALESKRITAQDIMKRLEDSPCKSKIIIIDACREGVNQGDRFSLFEPSKPGVYIACATSKGKTAKDGKDLSPYTEALLKQLVIPWQRIATIIDKVTNEIADRGEQIPWSSSTGCNFVFNVNAPSREEKEDSELLNDGRSPEVHHNSTKSMQESRPGQRLLLDKLTIDSPYSAKDNASFYLLWNDSQGKEFRANLSVSRDKIYITREVFSESKDDRYDVKIIAKDQWGEALYQQFWIQLIQKEQN